MGNLNAHVTIDPDTGKITPEIDRAVEAADTEPTIQADTTTIPGEITSAVDAADTTATLQLDSSALTEATGKADELGGSLVRVRDLATAIGVAFGAKEALGFFVESVQAASDLAESTNKAKVVFQEAAGEVLAFGKGAAQAVGLANTEAIEAASSFGALFTTTGLGNKEAAQLSTRMVTLAADLASVNNVPVDEALERLRSGLIGEAEPLRRLNVLLSANAVEAKATEMGLRDAHGELSEGAKVQARYALIMEQTARFQGDFANTSDQLANKQRILQAEFKQIQVTVGNVLLPTILDLANNAQTTLLPAFEAFAVQAARLGAAVLPTLAASAGSIVPIMDALASVIEVLPDELLSVVISGQLFSRMLGKDAPMAARGAFEAIGLLTGALRSVAPEAADAITQLATFTAVGFQLGGPWGAAIGAGVGLVAGAIDAVGGQAQVTAIDVSKLTNALTANALVTEFLRQQAKNLADSGFQGGTNSLRDFKAVAEENIGTAKRLGEALVEAGILKQSQVNRVIEENIAKQRQQKADTEASTVAVEGQGTAFDQAKEAATAYNDALEILAGGATDQFAAQTAMAQAITALDEAWAAAGGSIDTGTEAGVKNREALVAAVSAAQSYAGAIVAAGGSTEAANAPLRDLAGRIAFAAAAANQAPPQIAALLQSLGLLTPVAAQGVTDAASLQAALAGVGPAASATGDAVAAADVPGKVRVSLNAATGEVVTGTQALAAASGQGGAQAGTAIGQGVASTAPGSVEAAARLADQTLGYITRLTLNGTALNAGLGAGTLLASGLAQGITQHTPWVEEAARQAVRAAEKAAREEAESRSPSRLFARIGADLGAGMAVGIESSLGVVKGAAANTVATAAVATRAGVDAAAAAPTVVVEPSPTIGALHITASSDPQALAASVGRELAFQRRFAGAGR